MLVCIAAIISSSNFSFSGVISTFVSYVAKMATGRFEPSLGAVSILECERLIMIFEANLKACCIL